VTGFGTTAFTAALPVSVGTPDVKSTCGVGIIIVLFIADFSGVSCGKISRPLHSETESFLAFDLSLCGG